MSTIRAREAAVQDSEHSVYQMHEKDSEDSEDKMHEGWQMEDGRWKMGGGLGPYRRILHEFPQRKLELESANKPDFPEDFSKTPVKLGLLLVWLPPVASSEPGFSCEIWGSCVRKRDVR